MKRLIYLLYSLVAIALLTLVSFNANATQLFFVTQSTGAYLGSFNGPSGGYWNGTAWGNAPSGVISVPSPPVNATDTWNGSAWVPTAATTALNTFNAATGAGLAITSTGTASLSATYALDQVSQSQLYQIASYAHDYGVFPNGGTTMAYPDITGVPHTFNATQIANLLQAVAPYVTTLSVDLQTIQNGGSASWPDPTATIP
jgi:hypothetical protein